MTKQDLLNALLIGIDKAEAEKNNSVTISRGAATELVTLLSGMLDVKQPRIDEEGKMLFYCADCGRSFRAEPREDPECFEKWCYHRWSANCPKCQAEVVQNDRYWR